MNSKTPICQSSCVSGQTGSSPLPASMEFFGRPLEFGESGMRKLSAATVAIWLHPGGRRVLMGYNTSRRWWEFPGGKNKDYEIIEGTARREFTEETGLVVRQKTFREVGFYQGDTAWFCALFSITYERDENPPELPATPPDATFLEWRWVSCEVFQDLARDMRPGCQQILQTLGMMNF